MVDWKLYIESPQKRALDLCFGSFPDGYGNGSGSGIGYGYGYDQDGDRDGAGAGDGDAGWATGDGRSATVW